MATEAVNGMEYTQYGQPAELAASMPSHQPSASQGSNTGTGTGTGSSGQQKADPQEIGWYFVEQYYTTLSKSPDKIHLFYNKKSQLITGTEAEKILPAVGSKAISEKIRSLDLQECKIRVLNVDSQASYDNIVVQVIGEMSNKNQPHHKFVQTFILATQPNGYFVLNDIFRYLNVDEDEIVEDGPAVETAKAVDSSQPLSEAVPTSTSTPERSQNNVTSESAADQVDEKLQAAVDEPSQPTDAVNGTDASTTETDEAEPAPETEAAVEPEAETEAEEPTPTPAAADEETAEAEAEPESGHQQADAESEESTSAAAPAVDVAPVKKTWASMVGIRAPVVPAIPQTQAPAGTSTTSPAQSKARTATNSSQPQQSKTPEPASSGEASTPPSQSNGWQEAGKKTKQQPKAQEGIIHAYIKNVNDKIDARVLREVLEKYGKLKYYDVSRPKQCAFVEFEEPAAYAAAVAENPHTVGSESINVEERRPRPSPNTFPRAGGTAGRGRGGNGSVQRSGSQGSGFNREAAPTTGRGTFQGQGQRGAKTAASVRGRGQGQSPAA